MDNHIELVAQPHPDPKVRRVGFELTDPYIEQCWGAVLGPTGVAILRRLPTLWSRQEPALLPAEEFARSLGLDGRGGKHSRLNRSLDRLTQFRLATWVDEGRALAVYTAVAPLTGGQLGRAPEWTRQAHDELLGAHVDRLVAADRPTPAVTSIKARLDRLQEPSTPQLAPSTALGR